MDSTHRLHLATKIHFALLKQLGSGIDVGLMLKRELYALDVLNVCRASDNDELEQLAEQFVQATSPAPLPSEQEGAWARPYANRLRAGNLVTIDEDFDQGFTPAAARRENRPLSWLSPLNLFGALRQAAR